MARELRDGEVKGVPWGARAFDYTEDEIAAVVDVMRRGDTLTQGPQLARFERELAAYLGAPHAFAVANGTSALDLAALLCGFGPGDEAIIPAHTSCASAIPFARAGARIRWADIDAETWEVSAASIERLITPRTKAIVAVHLYGLMADMETILALARGRGIRIVEDCAQALGAEQHGRKAGSLGDCAAFSFHSQKVITTLGEGGALAVRSAEDARKVPGLRDLGMRPLAGERPDYWLPAIADVDADLPGVWPYNFCLGEVQCALGAELLRRVDAMNEIRVERARRLRSRLEEFPELRFQAVPAGRKAVHLLLPARYDGRECGKHRDDLIRLLWREYGVKALIQYRPLYRYPLFSKAGLGAHDCPNSDDFFDNMVSFPFDLRMSDAQFEYLMESTARALKRLRG